MSEDAFIYYLLDTTSARSSLWSGEMKDGKYALTLLEEKISRSEFFQVPLFVEKNNQPRWFGAKLAADGIGCVVSNNPLGLVEGVSSQEEDRILATSSHPELNFAVVLGKVHTLDEFASIRIWILQGATGTARDDGITLNMKISKNEFADMEHDLVLDAAGSVHLLVTCTAPGKHPDGYYIHWNAEGKCTSTERVPASPEDTPLRSKLMQVGNTPRTWSGWSPQGALEPENAQPTHFTDSLFMSMVRKDPKAYIVMHPRQNDTGKISALINNLFFPDISQPRHFTFDLADGCIIADIVRRV
jgi:hypothetical protein